MPTIILRTAPDRDQYVLWSTIVDNVTHVGTRDETMAYLLAEHGRRHQPEATRALDAADATGTSDRGGWGAYPVGPFLVHEAAEPGPWLLYRGDLAAYADALVDDATGGTAQRFLTRYISED